MLISVVIPVYRNAGSLRELHQRVVATIARIPDATYEIIFANDGSDDESLEILKSLSDSDENITVINLSRNFGQHAANNAAFQYASGDVIVNMSADLQDPPEIIEQIVDKIRDDNDIVLAAREKVKETFFKRLTSGFHYKLIRISVPSYPTKGFDFWGVNKRAFKAFMSFNDVVRRNQTDLLSIGFKVSTITYEKQKRIHGKSQYSFLKRLDISLSQILATAVWPLRIAAVIGFLFTILGILTAIVMMVRFFVVDPSVNGWTSIISILLITTGTMMGMMGVMGEYMWRMYYETKRRPLYFIESIYGQKAGQASHADPLNSLEISD